MSKFLCENYELSQDVINFTINVKSCSKNLSCQLLTVSNTDELELALMAYVLNVSRGFNFRRILSHYPKAKGKPIDKRLERENPSLTRTDLYRFSAKHQILLPKNHSFNHVAMANHPELSRRTTNTALCHSPEMLAFWMERNYMEKLYEGVHKVRFRSKPNKIGAV